MSAGTTTKAFIGKPIDLGAQVFTDIVMPVIREASSKMDAQSLAALYVGFLSAAYGSMQADFGKEITDRLLEDIQAAMQSYAAETGRPH